MNAKEKIIELLKEAEKKCDATKCDFNGDCLCDYDNQDDCIFSMQADYLLKNGVVVLPVKIGEKFYDICEFLDGTRHPEIYEMKADNIEIYNKYPDRKRPAITFCIDSIECTHDDFGDTLFLTREEAERALAERREDE